MSDGLWMYTITDSPSDYPGKFVVRAHLVTMAGSRPAAAPLAVASSLDAARARLPPGLTNLGRYDGDEPHILETWV